MNTRNVLTIAAVIALLFAVGFLLIPASIGLLYGFTGSPAEVLITRFFGSALLALGLINWLARDADYATLRPILLGNMIGDGVGALVGMMGTVSGVTNALGWSTVVLYLLLGLAFAYLYFMGQSVNVRQRA
jgi:hypothetical protein